MLLCIYTWFFKNQERNGLMKRRIFACALIVICLAMAAYATLAYFNYEDAATNVITAGDIKIDLQELSLPEEGGDPVPFENVVDVVPGTEVSKIVQIKNIGGQAAWIRISLERSIVLAEGAEGEADLSLIGYDLNQEKWTEKDGWYYYNTALAADETTEPLFTKVIFSKDMSNLYQESEVMIQVNAQATQAANNGDTVLEAAGWTETE